MTVDDFDSNMRCVMCVKDRQKFIICDEIAMAVALDDTIATKVMEVTCAVETTGSLTRGQMVIDQRATASSSCVLVTELDSERIVQLLTAALVD